MDTIRVSLSLREAVLKIEEAIVRGSTSGELIDKYYLNDQVVVLVFEKYYMRAANRLTLTVTVDSLEGATRVHYVGGGGSQSIFYRFDWGASQNFAEGLRLSLTPYII